MSSTSKDLDAEFVSQLKLSDVRHLEVETYTFAVLPAHLRQDPLETSIAKDIEQAKKILGDTDTRTHGHTD